MAAPALALALLLAAEAPAKAEAFAAAADALYARRAEGAQAHVADPALVTRAIAEYQRALELEPDALPARIGLLRALFFRGGFCGETPAAKKATFERAKGLAVESMRRLDKRAAARSAAARLEAFRKIPGAEALSFWAAVSWGQWALDHKLAAAWQGAAGKLRDLVTIAIALDPGYEQGSPHLVLGRLHAESPKLPFLTGWISRKKGIASLRQAHQVSPRNSVVQYYLADALLDHEPQSRGEALGLLEVCAAQEPRPEFLVEDRHYARLARARLADPAPKP